MQVLHWARSSADADVGSKHQEAEVDCYPTPSRSTRDLPWDSRLCRSRIPGRCPALACSPPSEARRSQRVRISMRASAASTSWPPQGTSSSTSTHKVRSRPTQDLRLPRGEGEREEGLCPGRRILYSYTTSQPPGDAAARAWSEARGCACFALGCLLNLALCLRRRDEAARY